jgi:hypothetical protein
MPSASGTAISTVEVLIPRLLQNRLVFLGSSPSEEKKKSRYGPTRNTVGMNRL